MALRLRPCTVLSTKGSREAPLAPGGLAGDKHYDIQLFFAHKIEDKRKQAFLQARELK